MTSGSRSDAESAVTVPGYAVREFGGPEVMEFGEVTLRPLGPRDIRIAVAYSGVNFLDVHQRSGKYPRRLPFVPGNEGAGTVIAVGEDVADIVPGERVAFAMHADGSYANEVVVSANQVARVPTTVSLRDAAALTLQGVTALCLVEDEGRVRPGSTVLVHSASGGAGVAIAQVARHTGARVLALVSTADKAGLARDAGADEVSLYSDAGGNFAEWVADRTEGRGVDVVFDAVGGDTLQHDLDSLGRLGHLIIYGQTAGPFPALELPRLAVKSISVTYSRVSAYIAEPGAFRQKAERLFELAAAGAIVPANLTEFAAADAAMAHDALVNRAARGKMVLRFLGES